jgi:rod shape-determining protein MreD
MNDFNEALLIGGRSRKKTARIRPWVVLVTPLAAILFQVYVPLYLPLLHYLELPLLVTVYLAVSRRSQIGGALIGSAIGLVQDALSYQPLGILGMVKTLVGYAAASLGVRLDTEHAAVRLALGAIFFLIHQSLYWLVRRTLLGAPTGLEVPQTLLAAVANGLVGVLLFAVLDKLKDREE